MVDQVFTAEAMATCAARGHAWRTVRTWHAVGYQECSRCGETPPFGSGYQFATCVTDWSKHDLQSIPVRSAVVARPPRAATESRPSRDADATDSVVIRAGALDGLAELPPGRIERLKGRPWGANAEQRRRRNDDIARRVAAGEDRRAIAAAHGIHPSRISQILAAAKQSTQAGTAPATSV